LTWFSAAKFVNFLNTNQGYLPAYKFDTNGSFQLWSSGDVGYSPSNPFRNSFAKYWLPSADEWYKSAFGNQNGDWFDFATGSDSAPTPVTQGTQTNSAVYAGVASGPADVTNAGGLSPWGTMAQLGNTIEWLETEMDKTNNSTTESRLTAGGNWNTSSNNVGAKARDIFSYGQSPGIENISASWAPSFRVSMNPSPTHFVLRLSNNTNMGYIAVSPAGIIFTNGSAVTLNAVPLAGYVFTSWSGDVITTSNNVAIIMSSNTAISANYGPDNLDSDGDGLSNYQENIIFKTDPNLQETQSPVAGLYLASQKQAERTSGRNEVLSSPNLFGLFSSNQILNLKFGGMVLGKTNNQLVLNFQINQSTNLTNWTSYRDESLVISNAPADKMFLQIIPKNKLFRLRCKNPPAAKEEPEFR